MDPENKDDRGLKESPKSKKTASLKGKGSAAKKRTDPEDKDSRGLKKSAKPKKRASLKRGRR